MTEAERLSVIGTLAENPRAGDVIQGAGGCRKVRIAGRGKGKSGGYRVLTLFGGRDVPVFLLTVFGKGDRADLSKAERNELAKIAATIIDNYRRKIRQVR